MQDTQPIYKRLKKWIDYADVLPAEKVTAEILGCAVGTIWGRIIEMNRSGYTIERTRTAIIVHERPPAIDERAEKLNKIRELTKLIKQLSSEI